jgi:hypothetical protein
MRDGSLSRIRQQDALLEATEEKEKGPLRWAQPLLPPCLQCGGSEGSAIESLFTYCTASILALMGSGFATPYFMIDNQPA